MLCLYLKPINITEHYLMIQIFLELYVASEDHSICSFLVIILVTSIYRIKQHSALIQSYKIHEDSSFVACRIPHSYSCLEVPATYVRAVGAAYVLVISPAPVIRSPPALLYWFVADNGNSREQWSERPRCSCRRNLFINENNSSKLSCCLLSKCISVRWSVSFKLEKIESRKSEFSRLCVSAVSNQALEQQQTRTCRRTAVCRPGRILLAEMEQTGLQSSAVFWRRGHRVSRRSGSRFPGAWLLQPVCAAQSPPASGRWNVVLALREMEML